LPREPPPSEESKRSSVRFCSHAESDERVSRRCGVFFWCAFDIVLFFFLARGGLQDPIPGCRERVLVVVVCVCVCVCVCVEIRGWPTRRDRRRHGSPQLVPGCRRQLGQVPLRLLLPSAGGQARQGKTSRQGGGRRGRGAGVAGNGEKPSWDPAGLG